MTVVEYIEQPLSGPQESSIKPPRQRNFTSDSTVPVPLICCSFSYISNNDHISSREFKNWSPPRSTGGPQSSLRCMYCSSYREAGGGGVNRIMRPMYSGAPPPTPKTRATESETHSTAIQCNNRYSPVSRPSVISCLKLLPVTWQHVRPGHILGFSWSPYRL